MELKQSRLQKQAKTEKREKNLSYFGMFHASSSIAQTISRKCKMLSFVLSFFPKWFLQSLFRLLVWADATDISPFLNQTGH